MRVHLTAGTPAALLVSAGEDGAVRAWPLSVLMGHASAPGEQAPGVLQHAALYMPQWLHDCLP